MLQQLVQAIHGERPFDLFVRHVQIVNVFNATIVSGSIGIVNGKIAYIGGPQETRQALQTIDGDGCYALPGFVDSHMHLESSMLVPSRFAREVLACGTTTVAADPHETANVLGLAGVRELTAACRELPLRVLMMAPSTVPSAPGYEDSGYSVGAVEAEALLSLPGICGLGEVMDFNGVADGEERILSVVGAAARRGCIVDGHASVLTGPRLQAFRAVGIDSDHTTPTAEKLREELALGFTVQIQGCMLHPTLVQEMNDAPVQDRICLVTDDVPLPRLMRCGHLNHVVQQAIELGLDPMRAIRFATINPAVRLRLYDVGGIAPGMVADIQLVRELRRPKPELVLCGGRAVWEKGRFLQQPAAHSWPDSWRASVKLQRLQPADFAVRVPVPEGFRGGSAAANLICQDGVTVRTGLTRRTVRLRAERNGFAAAETTPLLKMAVFNRHGKPQHGLALIDGMDHTDGAAALTYGHDSHNLAVFGGNDADMALAANAVIDAQGGLCSVRKGRICTLVPLPLAGLMCDRPAKELLAQLEQFTEDCRRMGISHKNIITFLTIMPLAVSPEIKCTDHGLLDVVHKRFLPLIDAIKESSTDET